MRLSVNKTKSKVVASDFVSDEAVLDVVEDNPVTDDTSVGSSVGSKDNAVEFLRKAIDCLCEDATDDQLVRDAIADISVVLLSLSKSE